MNHIVYLLALLDQAIIEVFLFHQLTHRTKPYLHDVALWFGLFSIVYFVFNALEQNSFTQNLQSAILLPVQILVIWRCTDPFRKKLTVLIINIIIPILVEVITIVTICIVCNIRAEDFYDRYSGNIYVSVGRVMVNDWLLLCVIGTILIFLHKELKNRTFRRDMGLILGFTGIHLCFMCAYFRTNMDTLTEVDILLQYAFQAMLIIMIFLQYFNAQRTRQLMKSEEELRVLQSRMETDYSYYQLASSKFTEISALRHDIQNQMQTVRTLLHSENGTEQAENIIEQLQTHLDEIRAVNYCGNRTINAILTVKLGEDRMQGIRTEIELHDCEVLPFEDYDLCSLVSNMFDNAVNACLQCDAQQERFVELKSGIRDGYFILRCVNSCHEQANADAPSHRDGHGFGREILNRICQKYDGSFSLRIEDGTACAVAALSISNV